MQHNNKKFDQSLHDENDKQAKEAVKKYLQRVGRYQVLDGLQYGVDLVLHDSYQVQLTIEVERRQWMTECNYVTIHVPERKQKFLSENCILFAISQDCTIGLWCKGSEILKSEIILLNNKYMTGEPFFNVPKKLWTRVVL